MNLKKKFIGIKVSGFIINCLLIHVTLYKMFLLYKKWNFILFLNNLVLSDFLAIQHKLYNLPFDFYKFYFFNYSKTTQNQQIKLLKIKNYYN